MSELLSLNRMARRLGVTQAWLRDYAEKGDVPSLQAGPRLLFNPAAVIEALSAKATNTSYRTQSEESEVPRD